MHSTPNPWEAFGPDVLAGLISALASGLFIGGVFFVLQWFSDRRSITGAHISAAYDNLLDITSRLMTLDLNKRDDAAMLGELRLRMTYLAELVDKKTPEFAMWLEAERQLSLATVLESSDLVGELAEGASVDEHLDARGPFLKWLQRFTNNIRYWRTGKMTPADMEKQAGLIEADLRKKGKWREN